MGIIDGEPIRTTGIKETNSLMVFMILIDSFNFISMKLIHDFRSLRSQLSSTSGLKLDAQHTFLRNI